MWCHDLITSLEIEKVEKEICFYESIATSKFNYDVCCFTVGFMEILNSVRILQLDGRAVKDTQSPVRSQLPAGELIQMILGKAVALGLKEYFLELEISSSVQFAHLPLHPLPTTLTCTNLTEIERILFKFISVT